MMPGNRSLNLSNTVAVVVYHATAAWRSTRYGWHVMIVTAAIGALGLYTVLITIWPTGAPAAVLRTARTLVMLLMAVQMVQRTRLVLHAQRGELKRPAHRRTDRP